MSIRIPLSDIQERAKERPEGYFEEVLASGRVDGDVVELEEVDFKRLVRKYSEPSLLQKVVHVADAAVGWALQGFPVVDEATFRARMATCGGCEYWTSGLVEHCRKCGCTKLKLTLASEVCPLGKWKAALKGPAKPMQEP